MTVAQLLAIVIFLAMFTVIIAGRVHRFIPALAGAVLTVLVVFLIVLRTPEMVARVLNLGHLFEPGFWLPRGVEIESHGVNWQTMVFIGGMMLMVEGLGEVGFFRWLCLYLARLARCRVVPILLVFMLLSGFLAMFIASITVLLFMAIVTVELARLLKFDPVPVIIAEIFAANTGGAATMSGDPPNIIIGTALNFTFTDFVLNTGPIAWAGMLAALAFFYLAFRKVLVQHADSEELLRICPAPQSAVTSPHLFFANTVIFILVVILLVTHAQTGLSVALIGVIAALLTILVSGRLAGHLIKRMDWRTLLFFFGLFITVGGLEETGVMEVMAAYIGEVSGGSLLLMIPLILYVSAFASAIVDNIPLAAVMVPVIRELALSTSTSLPPLAWTLALGTDIGGNATPIGASANVVGTAIAEREGYRVGWGRYLKYAMPATIIVVVLSHLLLLARYA